MWDLARSSSWASTVDQSISARGEGCAPAQLIGKRRLSTPPRRRRSYWLRESGPCGVAPQKFEGTAAPAGAARAAEASRAAASASSAAQAAVAWVFVVFTDASTQIGLAGCGRPAGWGGQSAVAVSSRRRILPDAD